MAGSLMVGAARMILPGLHVMVGSLPTWRSRQFEPLGSDESRRA